jgi:hypothetical protein
MCPNVETVSTALLQNRVQTQKTQVFLLRPYFNDNEDGGQHARL